jgi:hypothetical protein
VLISYTLGQTSVVFRVKIRQDTTGAAPGKGLTGLTNSSSGLIIGTIADNEATTTTYTQAASHIQTITTLGTYAAPSASNCRFKEVDATNHPGVYEVQLADARFAVANSKSLLVSLSGVSGMMDCDVVIPLTSVNPYDGIHYGISALPNTACTTNASLLTSGTGTDQLSVSSGKVLLQATQTGVTIPTVTTVGTLTTYTGNTPQTGDAYARLGAPAGASIAADIASVKTDTTNTLTHLPAPVKKNSGLNNFTFLMTDNVNHAPDPGLTVTAQRSIDGGALGACANSVTAISNGYYKINLAAADLNGDVIAFRFSAAGADDTNITVLTNS